MHTYSQILYQLVFSTWKREQTLEAAKKEMLYKYIWGILKNNKCHLYRIGGVADHLHIVTHVHPTVALATLVKNIKLASSDFIKSNQLFPFFKGWQEGYGAFTYSFSAKDNLIEYVKEQEKHHHTKSFREEFIELLNEHGVVFDEKYLL